MLVLRVGNVGCFTVVVLVHNIFFLIPEVAIFGTCFLNKLNETVLTHLVGGIYSGSDSVHQSIHSTG